MASDVPARPLLAGESLCVTIDDFPHQHGLSADRALAQLVDDIVEALARAFAGHPTARPIFFVNSDAIGDMGYPMERLAQVGLIGNHTASHCDVSAVPPDVWRADVLRCQRSIEPYVGEHPRYFRFPFLRTGSSPAVKDAAYRFLADQGFITIPGTCPTADWQFAEVYERAHRAGDGFRCEEIERAAIAHIVAALQNAVRERDRSPIRIAPLVLVLHANRLLAATIGKLLQALGDLGMVLEYPPLSLFPSFERYDEYIGTWGGSYLLQCTSTGRERLASGKDWLSLQCAEIAAKYGAPAA